MKNPNNHNRLITGSLENQCHIIAEVTGSNPVPPTIVYNRQNLQSLHIESILC